MWAIGNVTVVADRAMMSQENLTSLEDAGIKYVIAAKLKKLPKKIRDILLKKGGNQVNLGQERHDLQEFSLVSEKRRLVVTYSEKRAKKDRERALEKARKKIGSGKSAKSLISNRGYKKYLKTEGSANIVVDPEKLAEAEKWDGLHGIITNDQNTDALELLKTYKRLWVIEESFRVQKTDLSIRPIYHFKPERVEAHILLCYLAFSLIRYAEHRIELQKEKISIQEMRRHLWRTQASILKDHKTGKIYRVPPKPSEIARKLYQTFGLVRNERIRPIEIA